MNVVESVQQLLHDLLDLAQTELYVDVGQQSGQIVFAKVEHQIERRAISIVCRCLRSTDFDQIYDVLVFEQLENADFTESRDWELLRGRR